MTYICGKIFVAVVIFATVSADPQQQLGTKSAVGRTIGIDIGTANVRVAVFNSNDDTGVEVLRNEQGIELTPAYVAFTAGQTTGRRLIGIEAKVQLVENPNNTVFSVLPMLGLRFHDPMVQAHIKQVPYKVVNRNDTPVVEVNINGKAEAFTPAEIAAMLLSKMKYIAERHLDDTVTGVVLSVPGCLGYAQRMAMRDAGKIAGFDAVYVVNAPMAAAVAARARVSWADAAGTTTMVTIDIGGSCLGVTVASSTAGSVDEEAHGATCELGGEKLQQRVMQHMLKKLHGKCQKDAQCMLKLQREAERAVRQLSFDKMARLEVALPNGDDFWEIMTRDQFQDLCMDLFRPLVRLIKRVLQEASISSKDVSNYALIGGASRIPAVRQLVKEFFDDREPSTGPDADLEAVIGAAYWGKILAENETSADKFAVITMASQTVGYETTKDFVKMISNNEPLPATNQRTAGIADSKVDAVSNALLVVQEVGHVQNPTPSLVGSVANVSLSFPPTTSPDLWMEFKMQAFDVLQVTLSEMKTITVISVQLEHHLSSAEIDQARLRCGILDRRDQRFARRSNARDELEQLAWSLKMTRLDRENLTEHQLGVSGTANNLNMQLHKMTTEIIEWLDSDDNLLSYHDMHEFLRKRQELEMAAARTDMRP